MASGLSSQIWHAVGQLNPGKPMEEADKSCILALLASSEAELRMMREFLLGPSTSNDDVSRANVILREYVYPLRALDIDVISKAELILVFAGSPDPQVVGTDRIFHFDPQSPQSVLVKIIQSKTGMALRLSLGRHLPGIRLEIARRVVRDVSTENAVFVITTALGDVLPSALLPLIGIAEAASDTTVLTVNQIRMLFVLGAIYGADVGYKTQWKEIASILGAAFGWRAIARELVSKIPFGGGLVPKGAIAYAGTTAAGEGIIFYYTTGRHMTRAELKQ